VRISAPIKPDVPVSIYFIIVVDARETIIVGKLR
jgi:hypothetical protein